MCLGVPGQILEIKNSNEAVVDFWGVHRCVRLEQLDPRPLVGDYVIDHSGYAVRVIPIDDVPDTLALYEVLLTEAGEDPIAGDIAEALDCASRANRVEPVVV